MPPRSFQTWDAVVQAKQPKPACDKFKKFSSVTQHASDRIAQRGLKPGMNVHTVVDDRTGTLITLWRRKRRTPRKAARAKNQAELQAAYRRLQSYAACWRKA